MSDDLGALASQLAVAVTAHLTDAGWRGRVRATPWINHDALQLEVYPEGSDTHGSALVPANVWRDTAARPELVAHLCRTYLAS